MNFARLSILGQSSLSLLLFAYVFLCCAQILHADQALSVTVTPPLIRLTIGPGESWTSTLKVVNNNNFDVTYYTQTMDMESSGEEGRSKFIPLVEEKQDPSLQSYALAQWIEMSNAPITVKAGSSADLPFTITIPDNAEPGGHYAAILVGTQPGSFQQAGSLMKVSSFVSSLIFVRIKGDVTEEGRIREFSTEKSLYQSPQADFTLRFENTGNTHVRPEGTVTIYNTWGKVRGEVPINQDGNFGNVLPQSVRKFQFSWQGEQSLFDIGPYSAVVALAYGEDGKKNVSATTYFWVVPVVPVAITVGALLFFVLLVMWFIRRYIKRALALSLPAVSMSNPPKGAALETVSVSSSSTVSTPAHVPVIQTLIEPLREGVIDLRSISSTKKQASLPTITTAMPQNAAILSPERLTLSQFFRKYRLFFAFLVVIVIGCIGAWWYFAKVLVPQRSFQISDVIVQEEPAPKK